MNPDLQLLHSQALAAFNRGASMSEVNGILHKVTNGQFPTFMALSAHMQAEDLHNQSETAARVAEHSPASNFLAAARHGATFGLDVPIASMFSPERGAALRKRMEDMRDAAPGATMLSEAAGGLMLPVGAAEAGAGSLLGSAAKGGAAVGGLTGGLLGAGESDPGVVNRAEGFMKGAVPGAAIGALTAGMGSSLNNAFRRFGVKGQAGRVAGELRRTTGVEDVNALRGTLRDAEDEIRQKFYKPLENAHQQIDDPEIKAFLEQPELRSYVSRSVADGKRAPSFVSLQKTLTRMRKADRIRGDLGERVDELEQLMEDKLNGYAEANAKYYGVKDTERGLKLGLRNYKTGADVEDAVKQLTPTQQAAFRTGQVSRALDALETQHENAVPMLRNMLDAGPSMSRRLRTYFPDDNSYAQFRAYLRKESDAAKVRARYKSLAKKTGIAAVLGGGAYGIGHVMH